METGPLVNIANPSENPAQKYEVNLFVSIPDTKLMTLINNK